MFKYKPDAKYEILPFQDKLELVFVWIDKMGKQRTSSRGRESATLKKIKAKSPTGKKSPRSPRTPKSSQISGFPSIQMESKSSNTNTVKLKE